MANEGASPLGASGRLTGLPKRASRHVLIALIALIAANIDASPAKSPAKARGAKGQAPGAREIPNR